MPVLKNYPIYQQADENSCWAAAARSILNFKAGKADYASDQALADAYAARTGNPGDRDIHVMRSAADVLARLGIPNNIDDAPIPTPDELVGELNKNRPFLSIVGDTRPKNGKPDKAYKEGHWVALIGISDDGKNELSVFDPADGKLHLVAYDAAVYRDGLYWENTSYCGEV